MNEMLKTTLGTIQVLVALKTQQTATLSTTMVLQVPVSALLKTTLGTIQVTKLGTIQVLVALMRT